MNQRISKLQRWILTTAYENMVKKGYNPNDAFVAKLEIYKDYYKLDCHTGKRGFHVKAFFSEPQPVKTVTLSRSLARLLRMGLIHKLGKFYAVVLTDSGIEKAKELSQFIDSK